MGSVTASSARLRRAAPRPAVALAGGKTGAVAASAAHLRRTQRQAKVLADPLTGRWWLVELQRVQPVAEIPREVAQSH